MTGSKKISFHRHKGNVLLTIGRKTFTVFMDTICKFKEHISIVDSDFKIYVNIVMWINGCLLNH